MDRHGEDERQDHTFLFRHQLQGRLVGCKERAACCRTFHCKDIRQPENILNQEKEVVSPHPPPE